MHILTTLPLFESSNHCPNHLSLLLCCPWSVPASFSSSRAQVFLQKASRRPRLSSEDLPVPLICPCPGLLCTAGCLFGHLFYRLAGPQDCLFTSASQSLAQALKTWEHNHYLLLLIKILKSSSPLMRKSKQGWVLTFKKRPSVWQACAKWNGCVWALESDCEPIFCF